LGIGICKSWRLSLRSEWWFLSFSEIGRMTDPKTRDLIDSLGIKLFGYRDLQKLAFKPVWWVGLLFLSFSSL
jgi:hypothetical protein